MLQGTNREAAAEFLGTFILIVFGVGVVAQTVLSNGANGSYLAINLGWGLAVMLGVYTAGGVSGAHLNPAVTLALAVRRGFPWSKVVLYIAAQTVGAFVASAVVYLTYQEAFAAFDGGVRQVLGAQGTAGVFATYPQPYLSIAGGFVDQVVGTALLMAAILAITDQRNNATPPWLTPIIVGGLVVAIGVSFGFNAGYAINPARDFGPRLFTALAGWGTEVFSAASAWWWVPIVAPCVGAVVGAVTYDVLIANNHPPSPVGFGETSPRSPVGFGETSPPSPVGLSETTASTRSSARPEVA
jgi:MIP family channel proteins